MNLFGQKIYIGIFSGALLLSACGGGGGDSNATNQAQVTTSTQGWNLNGFSYETTANSSTTNKNGSKFDVVSLATEGDVANGAYSGSLLSFSVSRTDAGSYTTTSSTSDLVSAIDANPTAKVIYVQIQVGTGVSTGSTVYGSSAGATVEVTVDAAGNYHFTAPAPQTFTAVLDVLGGVAGAPDSAPVTFTDVSDL